MLDDVHKVKDPFLLYSTEVDGFSLTTLIARSQNQKYSFLLVKTTDNKVLFPPPLSLFFLFIYFYLFIYLFIN